MSKLPHILSKTRQGYHCELLLAVPQDCVWFEGHFDGAPILSGVAQIDWVMSLALSELEVAQAFEGIDVLKFQNVIMPGDELTMTLDHIPEKNQLRFQMQSGHRPLSSGRIVLREKSAGGCEG